MSTSPDFAYFGTPEVAATTLARLIESGFTPSLVVTSPDAPRGRGLVLTPCPTKELALSHNIPVLTPSVLDESTIAEIRKYHCDYAVVVAYGKIFTDELLAAFPRGLVNVHYSLLPRYRGATPLETALLAGETETGVTVQKVVREVDAGDILAQEATPIAPNETARELRPRLIELGARLLIETLPRYERGEITPIPQDPTLATFTRKIKKEDGLLSLPAGRQGSPQQHAENWNRYRAYADSIGTYFIQNDKRIKITAASLQKSAFVIERVIPAGKREISYADFARTS